MSNSSLQPIPGANFTPSQNQPTNTTSQTASNSNQQTQNKVEQNLKTVYRKMVVEVAAGSGNKTNTKAITLEKNIKFIKAVTLTSNDEDLVMKLNLGIDINGSEILPSDMEARVLYAYASVSPTDRMFQLGLIATGNGVIKVPFIHTDELPNTYKFTLTFTCLSE